MILEALLLDPARPIVVVRPPPEVSLYHRFENDLFAGVLERLRAVSAVDGVQPVVLPRVDSQRSELSQVPGFIVPEHAIDAQSLIAHADLVISAGGTMNREAVALGVPVYTTFEGRLGAVDEHLIGEGRLRKLTAVDELDLRKRVRGSAHGARSPRSEDAARAAALAPVRLSARAVSCPRRRIWPYNPENAPTDPLGGPSPPPALAAPAGGGRGAGRDRVLPRLSAALRQRAHRLLLAVARTDDLVGAPRKPAGADPLARLPAPLALFRTARLRGRHARDRRDRAAHGRRRRRPAPGAASHRPRHLDDRAPQRRDRAVLPALPAVPARRARCSRAASTSAARWPPSGEGARASAAC